MICSGKNSSELKRIIDGVKPIHENPTVKEKLDYAGPGYLVNMNVKYMIVYPNVKHCYHNNWTSRREGCNVPMYSILLFFGQECFNLIAAILFSIFLILYLARKKLSSYVLSS